MDDATRERRASVDEIAKYLGIKRHMVYGWIERKNMPAHRLGSLWKSRKEDVVDWIRDGQATGPNVSRKPR